MERYDYEAAVYEDIKDYILNGDIDDIIESTAEDDLFDALYDFCFSSDYITGNASGSYTFNAWQAEENICHNWNLISDIIDEFGVNEDILVRGPECIDVCIRCYILPQALNKVLKDREVIEYFKEF